MDDAEIKNGFAKIEKEIDRLRDWKNDFVDKVTPLFSLPTEVSILRKINHDLVKHVSEIKIYKDKIPEFSQRFGNIFKSMNLIEVGMLNKFAEMQRREFQGRLAIYSLIIAMLLMGIKLVWG